MTPRVGWVHRGDRSERIDGRMILTVSKRHGWWAASVRLRHELAPFYADEFSSAEGATRAADEAAANYTARHAATNGVTDGV